MSKSIITFIKEHWFQLFFVLLALVVIIIISYYYLNFLPGQQSQKEISSRFFQFEAKTDYTNCMSNAQTKHDSDWSANCIDNSYSSGCKIPSSIAVNLASTLTSDQEQCEKHYNDTLESIK